MKNHVWFLLVLLLAACASDRQPDSAIGSATGAALKHRKSDAKQEPVELQKPVSVEEQKPDLGDQGEPLPRKSEHNIEED